MKDYTKTNDQKTSSNPLTPTAAEAARMKKKMLITYFILFDIVIMTAVFCFFVL